MPNTLHELIGTAGWSLVAIVCVAVALGVGGVYRGPRVLAFWAWVKRRWAADYDAGHWLLQFLIWLDQGANLLISPFSKSAWADETLSSRAYRAWRDGKRLGWLMKAIDAIPVWPKPPEGVIGHCHDAYLAERHRQQLPPELRDTTNTAS
jgi:hypothetical protein